MVASPTDWDWWWGSWRDRIRCGTCRAVMSLAWPCPVCGTDYRDLKPTEHMIDGRRIVLPPTFAGAVDWSQHVLLRSLHREWCRPLTSVPPDGAPAGPPSSERAALVLLFWTYFETLMSWFYESAMSELPSAITQDLLKRYDFIGARLDKLHRLLFSASYGQDLDRLGYPAIRQHLESLQKVRNQFVHGNPETIDDAAVQRTAMMMPEFHRAWIDCFNDRCTRRRR